MQALLLCAGLGTRMKHLTKDTPKALVPVNGKPLIAWNLEKLKKAGFQKVIVNVHHYAQQIKDYLKEQDYFGLDIQISDESKQLLETGGAIKHARNYIDTVEPLLIHNVDIITDLDLTDLMASHQANDGIATLAVRSRQTSRYLIFEEESLHLTGWTNIKTKETKLSRVTTLMVANFGFSGVHVIDPSLFDFFSKEKAFSIIEVYLKAARTKNVYAYPHEKDIWYDVGKPESVELAEKALEKIF